jgi:hypothetical protein
MSSIGPDRDVLRHDSVMELHGPARSPGTFTARRGVECPVSDPIYFWEVGCAWGPLGEVIGWHRLDPDDPTDREVLSQLES